MRGWCRARKPVLEMAFHLSSAPKKGGTCQCLTLLTPCASNCRAPDPARPQPARGYWPGRSRKSGDRKKSKPLSHSRRLSDIASTLETMQHGEFRVWALRNHVFTAGAPQNTTLSKFLQHVVHPSIGGHVGASTLHACQALASQPSLCDLTLRKRAQHLIKIQPCANEHVLPEIRTSDPVMMVDGMNMFTWCFQWRSWTQSKPAPPSIGWVWLHPSVLKCFYTFHVL